MAELKDTKQVEIAQLETKSGMSGFPCNQFSTAVIDVWNKINGVRLSNVVPGFVLGSSGSASAYVWLPSTNLHGSMLLDMEGKTSCIQLNSSREYTASTTSLHEVNWSSNPTGYTRVLSLNAVMLMVGLPYLIHDLRDIYQLSYQYTHDRRAFGKPLYSYEAVSTKLGEVNWFITMLESIAKDVRVNLLNCEIKKFLESLNMLGILLKKFLEKSIHDCIVVQGARGFVDARVRALLEQRVLGLFRLSSSMGKKDVEIRY